MVLLGFNDEPCICYKLKPTYEIVLAVFMSSILPALTLVLA